MNPLGVNRVEPPSTSLQRLPIRCLHPSGWLHAGSSGKRGHRTHINIPNFTLVSFKFLIQHGAFFFQVLIGKSILSHNSCDHFKHRSCHGLKITNLSTYISCWKYNKMKIWWNAISCSPWSRLTNTMAKNSRALIYEIGLLFHCWPNWQMA